MLKTVIANFRQRLRYEWLVPMLLVAMSGFWFSVATAAPPKSGEVAPDFELANVDGGRQSYRRLQSAGRLC